MKAEQTSEEDYEDYEEDEQEDKTLLFFKMTQAASELVRIFENRRSMPTEKDDE